MSEKLPKQVSKFASHWAFRSFVIGIGLTLATAAIYLSWASQPLRRAKISEIVGSTPQQSVSVDGVAVNGRQVQSGAEITTGQQLRTSQNSKAVLQQADRTFVRVGVASSVTLENDCLQLNEGQVVISSTEGCLGAIVIQSAAKEGAVYVIERLGTVGQIKVLAGQVEASLPSNQAVQSITLAQNQKITLSLTGDDVGPVRLMLPSEVASILQGELFQGFQQPLANQNLIAGLSKPEPPKAAIAPKPTTPPQPQPSPQPTKAPTVVKAAPPPEPIVHANPPQQALRYESEASQQAEEKPASYQGSYSRTLRRRRMYEPSTEPVPYRRKRTRSPYLTSSYRRRSPSYSLPAYSPPSHPPTSAPPPATEAPPAVELPTAPVIEISPEMPPMEPGPVLEPLPPPEMVEPPFEGHP